MSVILDPPTTVLFVGEEGDTTPAVTEALRKGRAGSVRSVAATEQPLEELREDGSLGCVVAGPSLPSDSSLELCRAVRRADAELPVLLHVDEDRTDGLRDALDAGVTDVVPPSAPPDRLRTAVDEALASYHRRLVTAEESEMLRKMLDSLGKSIYVKDRDLRIIHHADVGGGLDPDDARGKTDLELYDENESARRAYEDGMSVIEGEQIIEREERIRESDLWMRTTKVPWRDDGSVRGLIGHTIDITEYKRKERKLEELRHRFTTFTRQLQHDLKTQIQIAYGLLDRVERGGDEQAPQLERTLERIDRIVEDYDELAKRSISVEEDVTPTNLREMAEEALSMVDTADVPVVIDVDADTCVNAPSSMLQTVLVNLLRDAIGHVDADDTVRVGATSDGFYVEDTSGEIPEFKREILEHTGYTVTQDGSGRELSIVKDQIDHHVWSIALSESREGGTRIEVTNCLVDREDDPSTGTRLDLDEQTVVGRLERPPSATYDENANRWAVSASGNDVFRQDNDFFFVHTAVEGPVSIQGKVHELDHVTDFSKGGFMIRDSLDTDATYGYLGKTPGYGTELLWRSGTGEDGKSHQLKQQATFFDWYRIDRVGDEVRMSLSMDGRCWQEIDRRRIDGDDPVHVGLVVCSTIPGEVCDAVFEDVVVRKLDDQEN